MKWRFFNKKFIFINGEKSVDLDTVQNILQIASNIGLFLFSELVNNSGTSQRGPAIVEKPDVEASIFENDGNGYVS